MTEWLTEWLYLDFSLSSRLQTKNHQHAISGRRMTSPSWDWMIWISLDVLTHACQRGENWACDHKFLFCPDKTIISCPLNALHGNIRRQQTSAAWFPFTSYTVSKEPYAAFANGLPAADCAVEWSFLMLLWGYYFYTYSFIFVCLRTVFWSWHTFHFPFFSFFRKCLKMDENFIQCEAVHSASQASCSNERADCLCTLAGCEEVCMCVSVCVCVRGWVILWVWRDKWVRGLLWG